MGPELSVCCPKLFLYGKEDTDCCNNNADDRQNEYHVVSLFVCSMSLATAVQASKRLWLTVCAARATTKPACCVLRRQNLTRTIK